MEIPVPSLVNPMNGFCAKLRNGPAFPWGLPQLGADQSTSLVRREGGGSQIINWFGQLSSLGDIYITSIRR